MKVRANKLPSWIMVFEACLAVVLVAVMILLALWYRRDYTDYAVDDEVYQFFGGEKVTYEDGMKLHYEDGTVTTSYEGGLVNVNDVPVIYAKTNKMMIPSNMAYVSMHNNLKMQRLNYFTTLYDCGTYVNISKDQKSTAVYDGFLFDGKDMYIFLEPVALNVGSMEISLGMLSYVKCVYDNYIEYYNSTTDTCQQIMISGSKVRAVSTSGYTIKLDCDVIINDTSEYILLSAIDSLPVLKLE